MNVILSTSAPWLFSSEETFSMRPLHSAQFGSTWIVDVPAKALAPLAAGPDAARRLWARRGYLEGSLANQELARMLRGRPEDFGAIGHIVLGADAVEVEPGVRSFSGLLHVIAPECIDGLQRLKVVADAAAYGDASVLERSVMRLEIVCGDDQRERMRRLHGFADAYLNPATAQDRLVRCPVIRRLMDADWEREGTFDPRRGLTSTAGLPVFDMAEVTRALACVSPSPRPDAAHLTASDDGLELLWNDLSGPLYRELFHGRMTPVGILRAVEARRAARAALDALPKRRLEGYGHLIRYAPELIQWQACRFLPVDELHDARSTYAWQDAIDHRLPAETVAAADRLVARYERVRPRPGAGAYKRYKQETSEYGLWWELLGA
ncbi:hypothetical protein ACIRNI_05115 [Streptomyces sp. NPDC093546]|uniref:hypothetical protein n=1 Tax=Streptomyces sp. NPDC093546 TaxID=3366040 RepID=UPI003818A557